MRNPLRQRRTWLGLSIAIALTAAVVAAGPSGGGHGWPGEGGDVSFFRVEVQKGLIQCAAGAGLAATDDVCANLSHHDDSLLTFHVPGGADVAIVEMRWEASNDLGGKILAMTIPVTFQGNDAQRLEGPSILRGTVASPDPEGAGAGPLSVDASAANASGLVLDQPFEVAMSSFVNFEVPENYTAFGDDSYAEKPKPDGAHCDEQEPPPSAGHGHGHELGGEGPPGPPYFKTSLFAGELDCAVGLGVSVDVPACPPVWFGADVDEATRTALIEVRWKPTSELGAATLAVTHPATLEDPAYVVTEGKSILRAAVPSTRQGGAEIGGLKFSVHGGNNTGVVIEQTFEVAVTIFVGMDPPEGFSAFEATS